MKIQWQGSQYVKPLFSLLRLVMKVVLSHVAKRGH